MNNTLFLQFSIDFSCGGLQTLWGWAGQSRAGQKASKFGGKTRGAQAVTSRATKTEKRSGKKEFRTISFVHPNRLIDNGIFEQIKIQ